MTLTMTAAEVARVMGVARSTVTREAQQTGQFAGVPAIRPRSGSSRQPWRFSRAAIMAVANGRRAA